MKMKAKGYSAGGAPKSRAQRRATLSSAQKNMLDGVQGREGSKQATSVIKDLSDEYGFKRAAKGGMGKGKRAKPLHEHGRCGDGTPRNEGSCHD
jgi:hypothetical protein